MTAPPLIGVPDTAQLIAAIAAARRAGAGRIALAPTGGGGYVLAHPLNLANLQDRPLSIVGSGQAWENGTGSIVQPDTGTAPAFDASGTSALRLARFTIKSQARARGAEIGILLGRTKQWPYPQSHNLADLILHLRSVPGANGGRGTVGIWNVACEHFLGTNVRIKADLPWLFAGFNDQRLAAPYGGELTGPWSMTLATLVQCGAYATRGPAYELRDCQNIGLLRCHAQRDSASTEAFAVRLAGRTALRAISIEALQAEQFPAIWWVDAPTLGSRFDATAVGCTRPYCWLSAGVTLTGCDFSVTPIDGPPQAMFANTTATLRGGTIRLLPGQRVVDVTPGEAPVLKLEGVTVLACDDAAIQAAPASVYTIANPLGTRVVSP